MTANCAMPPRRRRIAQDRRALHARRNFLEQLEPFRADAEFERRKSGGVAARASQARDQAGTNRIGHLREYNRYRASGPLQRGHGQCRNGENDLGREHSQLVRIGSDLLGIARAAPAVIDP
jgi:hypothetical protein